MQSPLVSIIVPIYKVEPYLRQCLDSIVNQTYTNLEIILVDDGSPDGCPAICDEYAAKDSRIIVIHKENGGLSDARNTGLDICKGEYISFVDSDDWVTTNYTECLINELLKNKADIAICSFIKTTQHFYSSIKYNNIQSIILAPIDAIKKLWTSEATIYTTAWGMLYKRDLFDSIRYPHSALYEDERTTFKILYLAKKIVFIDIPFYFYFQHSSSITAQQPFLPIRTIKTKEERFHFFKEKKAIEIEQIYLEGYCWDFLHAYAEYKEKKSLIENDYKNQTELLTLFRESVSELSKINISWFHFILLNFFSSFPFIYTLYRKIT